MEKNAGQGGTVNATRWAIKRWNDWLEKRGIVIDISSVAPEVLAGHLYRFNAELKGGNNKPLSPSGLIGIRAGIQRGLIALRTNPLDIVKDPCARPPSTFSETALTVMTSSLGLATDRWNPSSHTSDIKQRTKSGTNRVCWWLLWVHHSRACLSRPPPSSSQSPPSSSQPPSFRSRPPSPSSPPLSSSLLSHSRPSSWPLHCVPGSL